MRGGPFGDADAGGDVSEPRVGLDITAPTLRPSPHGDRPGRESELAVLSGQARPVKLLWLIYAMCVLITVGLIVIVVLAFTSVSGQ